MVCVGCAERRQQLRDAILHGKMAEALDITVEGLRTMIGIDAGADHREEAEVEEAEVEEITPAKASARAR